MSKVWFIITLDELQHMIPFFHWEWLCKEADVYLMGDKR